MFLGVFRTFGSAAWLGILQRGCEGGERVNTEKVPSSNLCEKQLSNYGTNCIKFKIMEPNSNACSSIFFGFEQAYRTHSTPTRET